jgi:hypothetical protein
MVSSILKVTSWVELAADGLAGLSGAGDLVDEDDHKCCYGLAGILMLWIVITIREVENVYKLER